MIKLKKPKYPLTVHGQWCTQDERFFFAKTVRESGRKNRGGGYAWRVKDITISWGLDAKVDTLAEAKALVEKHGAT